MWNTLEIALKFFFFFVIRIGLAGFSERQFLNFFFWKF